MRINVTAYIRPNGKRRDIQIEIVDYLKKQVDIIEGLGLKFTYEELGEPFRAISVCISDDENDFDVATELANPKAHAGEEFSVEYMFAKMIGEFTINDYEEQLKEFLL